MENKFFRYFFPVLFIFFVFSQGDVFYLNQFALLTVKSLVVSREKELKDINPVTAKSGFFDCRLKWLEITKSEERFQVNNQPIEIEKLLSCGQIYLHLLNSKFPKNKGLALKAVEMLPAQTLPYYWLANSSNSLFSEETKPIFEKILEINPKDGLAWRYLGIVLLQEGDIPLAIQANINCCKYGDPGSNGCWNAGRLYEQEGQYDQAIYYYRLSKWQPSQEAAVRLESQLASGELTP
jgi:tetratricopeptide (TPR) repeat protein